jgi:hypothetical protein
MRAVLLIWVTPSGSGLATVTAKFTEAAAAPAPTLPMFELQMVPAGLPLAQDQAPVLLPALKVVLAGTVSVMVTPVAAWLPTFW